MSRDKNHITPPRLAEKLLLWFLKDELSEEVLGDLEEKFYHTLDNRSKLRAKRNYWYQVFKYMRPFAFKNYRSPNSNTTAMFRHNILISFRSFKKFKSTFAINLFGLAIGLASALLIYLWVYDELNMNKFNEKDSDRHVQVIYSYPTSGTIHTEINGTPNPLFEALAKDMPEVEYAVPIIEDSYYQGVLSAGDNKARAHYQFIGKGYFNIFSGDFIHGNKHEILSDKGEIAISEKLALSLFQSSEKAMGQLVELKDEEYGGSYLVSGVFKSIPNSSTPSDILFSYELFRNEESMKWYNGGTQAHLVLKEGVDLDQFNAKIKDYLKTVWENSNYILYAQPYSERHLYGNYENGLPQPGKIIYVRLFSIIAIFILVIACINYMNFSTANASRRLKEIGVKKAIGAGRKSLINQYFGESIFMAFLALVIALIVSYLLLPQFNQITGKQLTFDFSLNIISTVLAITLFTGLISGVYPALHLSGFNSMVALNGKLKSNGSNIWIRKGLVVFQFAVSVILIASVIVIYKQVEFIQNKNLGYNKDHIITFPKEGKLQENFQPFLTAVKNISGVTHASQMSGNLPGNIGYSQGYKWEGMSDEDRRLRFYQIRGGYELPELLGIELKAGRNFSTEFATDVDAIILNEAALEMINLKDPIGQKFGNLNPNAPTKEIIGVAKNFHFQSLQEKVKPFFFSISDYGQKVVVKLKSDRENETLAAIEAVYKDFNSGYPFEFKYLDDEYQAIYASEQRITTLSKYFAGIAIVISCLGLLALTAFSTQRRFKEIAIRKVLGSKSAQIVRMLSSEFMALVLVSIFIALPISYYLTKDWLNGFAYRINLAPVYFILAGGLMLIVAWLTIVTQTARSAKVNVTESLRSE